MFAWSRYATFVKVPPVLIFAPPSKNPPTELIVPVTERFPAEPASTKVKSVLGEPLESLMVSVPFAFDAPSVTTGVVLDNTNGEAPDKVTVLLAAIVVAPAIAPVAVIPPELLLMLPVISAPPAEIVKPPDEIV